MKTIKKNKGYTLVELIVVIVVLSIVFVLSFNLIAYGFNVFSKGNQKLETQNVVRLATLKINKIISTANDMSVLESLPMVLGQYNYIYIEGNKIMHRNFDGTKILTLASLDDTSNAPVINFNILESGKVLTYRITTQVGSESFEVVSNFTPKNLAENAILTIDPTIASAGGAVLQYSNPILDDSVIVKLDALDYSFFWKQSILTKIDEGTFVLNPPPDNLNFINLATEGQNGSSIVWSAGTSQYVVVSGPDQGKIYRPNSNSFDETVTLTATFSKGTKQETKSVDFTIKKLNPLTFVTGDDLAYDLESGINIELNVTGGNPPYTFESSNLPSGLILTEGGILYGKLTDASVFPIVFNVVVSDAHTTLMGNPNPNSITKVFRLIN